MPRRKRPEPAPFEAPTAAAGDEDPTIRNIRVLNKQLAQIEARIDSGKATPKDIAQAANIGRSLTLLRGEQRKREAADKKANESLTLDERIEAVAAFVEELPPERRDALIDRLLHLVGLSMQRSGRDIVVKGPSGTPGGFSMARFSS